LELTVLIIVSSAVLQYEEISPALKQKEHEYGVEEIKIWNSPWLGQAYHIGSALISLLDLSKDPYIFFSLAANALLLASAFLHLNRSTEVIKTAAVASVFLLALMLRYLQGISSLGPLVRNITYIVVDIGPFMMLLFLILFGFANAFNIMFSQSSLKSFDGFPRSFMSTFAMMLGGFNLEDFDDSSQPELMNILFIIFMFLVNIILLNMLIAIMSETYNRVSANAESEFLCARATLVVNILAKMPEADKLREIAKFKWIYALQPIGIQEEEKDEVDLRVINNSLMAAQKQLLEVTEAVAAAKKK